MRKSITLSGLEKDRKVQPGLSIGNSLILTLMKIKIIKDGGCKTKIQGLTPM